MHRGALRPQSPVDLSNTVTGRLQSMMDRDFSFIHNTGSAGEVVAVVGVRVHHDVIDIVELFGEHDATGVRIPGDETDILSPRTVLWRTSGSALTVIERVLALPDCETVNPSGPLATRGCWVPTRPGRSVWLAPSR